MKKKSERVARVSDAKKRSTISHNFNQVAQRLAKKMRAIFPTNEQRGERRTKYQEN
jgi:hypothetical protein